MTIGRLRDTGDVLDRDCLDDLSANLVPSGNFCRKIYCIESSINHISVAAGDDFSADLELVVSIPHASDFSCEVSFLHHESDCACKLSAMADLFIEQDIDTSGIRICQNIQDFN